MAVPMLNDRSQAFLALFSNTLWEPLADAAKRWTGGGNAAQMCSHLCRSGYLERKMLPKRRFLYRRSQKQILVIASATTDSKEAILKVGALMFPEIGSRVESTKLSEAFLQLQPDYTRAQLLRMVSTFYRERDDIQREKVGTRVFYVRVDPSTCSPAI
jgi:hypothetical protein